MYATMAAVVELDLLTVTPLKNKGRGISVNRIGISIFSKILRTEVPKFSSQIPTGK